MEDILKEITNKEVKNYILNYGELDQLNYFLDINYKETMIGIFNALYILSKHYDKNMPLIQYLVLFIESHYSERYLDEMKFIVHQIINFQNKTNDWKVKDKIKIRGIILKFQTIFMDIQNKTMGCDTNKEGYLEYLVFYHHDLDMLKKILKNPSYEVDQSFKSDNIFSKIIKRFIISDDFEEVHYLYHVILTFLNSIYCDSILKDKDQYLNIIFSCDNAIGEQVTILVNLLNLEDLVSLDYLLSKYHIHMEFPDIIFQEINSFSPMNIKRCDFTHHTCITIDSVEARCLDDAISVLKQSDGSYLLFIHIADVPSFVPYDSVTREEASFRTSSLYFDRDCIGLYPNSISNYICSLNSDGIKNTITYVFEMDPSFRVNPDKMEICLGKINVNHCFTYEEADARIRNPQNQELDDIFQYLVEFSMVRRKETSKKEVYREYENVFSTHDAHESLFVDSSLSANIVHESMVLVNYSVGKYFKTHGFPYIYRELAVPSATFMKEELNKIEKINSSLVRDRNFINILKDSYVHSFYTKNPVYHSGLDLECYSHSTSPLRRYMDSLGQYVIYDTVFLNRYQDYYLKLWEYRIDRAIKDVNSKVRQMDSFMREYQFLKYKKIRCKKSS